MQVLLPPGTIPAGSTLVLSLRVWLKSDESQTAEGSIAITISRQQLLADIAGGSNVSMSAATVHTLSAIGSSDPDSGGSDGLTFSWICIPPGGSSTGPCRNNLGQPLALPARSIIQLPSATLQPARTPYIFVVTVKKQWYSPATAMQTVLVNADIPENLLVAFTGATCLRSEADPRMCCQAASSDESTMIANSDSRFIFSAAGMAWPKVTGANETTPVYWELLSKDSGQQLELSTSDAPLGQNGAFFVLQASPTLLYPGGSYSVRVLASGGGWAEHELAVNRPPARGAFTACLLTSNVEPGAEPCVTSGQALLDDFLLFCNGWADPDDAGALEYRFGYCVLQTTGTDSRNSSCYSNAAVNIWLDWGPEAWTQMVFPQGSVTALAQVCWLIHFSSY